MCIYASGELSITLWRLENATKIIMFLFKEIESLSLLIKSYTDAVT